jgi:hypothetical protein
LFICFSVFITDPKQKLANSVKGHIVNILDYECSVSVTLLQLCHVSIKAATDNISMNGHGCVPIKLYLKIEGSNLGCNLPVSDLKQRQNVLCPLEATWI